MLWLEEKYINLIGPRLQRFHKVRHNLWSFRCPICGDSKKNEWKTRGSFYLPSQATSYIMGCFNCGASMRFTSFLKLQDNFLYDEFNVERYQVSQEQIEKPVIEKTKPVESKRLSLKGLECIQDLDETHPAVRYLNKRKIDQAHFGRLYFVLRFKQFESGWRGDKQKTFKDDHPRLIIPFFDKQGNITRLSARAFGSEQPKYIYMKIKEDASRVFGLDKVDPKKKVYVLEGPLDSLFFDNSIAVGSADLVVPELKSYSDFVLVPDNQPRNPEVCKSIKKMIDSGSPVCLWNKYWGKDINESILNGRTMSEVKTLIDESTVSGLVAQMKFSDWVKCKI